MKNNFEYYYNRVIDWAKLSCPDGLWGSEEHIETCWKMVEEEHKELTQALRERNTVALVDGLCDCFVVTAQIVELHKKEVSGKPQQQFVTLPMYCTASKSIIRDRNVSFLKTLYSWLCQAMDYVRDYNQVPIEACLLEVLRSNDSKFPTIEQLKEMYEDDEEKALQAASNWIESNSEYKEVIGKIKNGKCVFRCNGGTGKVVKPWCYLPPNLKSILESNNHVQLGNS